MSLSISPGNATSGRANEADLASSPPEVVAAEVEVPGWWTLVSDEALLREVPPEHRPEYC